MKKGTLLCISFFLLSVLDGVGQDQQRLAQAIEEYESGESISAQRKFESLTRSLTLELKEISKAYYYIGLIHRDKGENEAAYHNFGYAINRNKENKEALLAHGQLALQSGNLEDAAKSLEKLKSIAPGTPGVDNLLAELKQKQDIRDAAKTKQYIDAYGNNYQTYLDGATAYRKRDYATAIALLSEYLEEKPSQTDALYFRANSYYQQGELEKARTDLKNIPDRDEDMQNLLDKVNAILAERESARKEQARREQAEREREARIAQNSRKNLWKLGDRLCSRNHYAGVIEGVIDQWNEDKSKVKVKILGGPGGDYQGENIVKGNYIWVDPAEWYKCLGDEDVDYGLSSQPAGNDNTGASDIFEKQIIRKYAVDIAEQVMYDCHLEENPRDLVVDILRWEKYTGTQNNGYYINMKLSWLENPFFPQKRSAEGCLAIDEYGCNPFFFILSGNIPNLFGLGCLTSVPAKHKEFVESICGEAQKYFMGDCVDD